MQESRAADEVNPHFRLPLIHQFRRMLPGEDGYSGRPKAWPPGGLAPPEVWLPGGLAPGRPDVGKVVSRVQAPQRPGPVEVWPPEGQTLRKRYRPACDPAGSPTSLPMRTRGRTSIRCPEASLRGRTTSRWARLRPSDRESGPAPQTQTGPDGSQSSALPFHILHK